METREYAIKTVENPVIQDFDRLVKDYWDNWVVISYYEGMNKKGAVRFYCYVKSVKLTDLIMEMDRDYETYGECILQYVGPGRSNGGLLL
jgi:hypothetical protein